MSLSRAGRLPIPGVVTRPFGLVALLAVLATVGWLLSAQLRATEREVQPPATTAMNAAASVNLQQAASALASAKAFGGSYEGVDVSGFGVRVMRADATSFCVEAGGLHVAGPGGVPKPGRC